MQELHKRLKDGIKKTSSVSNFQLRGMSFNYYLDEGFLHEVYIKREENVDNNALMSIDLTANGIDSKFIGRHYIRTGGRPQTYYKAPEVSLGFWYKFGDNFKNISKKLDEINLEKALIVNGNFYTNKVTLQLTMCPLVKSGNEMPKFYCDLSPEYKKAIRNVIRKLRLPDLTPCVLSDMYNQEVNFESKAGFRYEQYLQMNDKKEALEVAEKLARHRWNYIESCVRRGEKLKRDKLLPSFYTVGARNKKEIKEEEYSQSNSRAVHMPEFHCEINSSPWVDKITDYFLTQKNGPIYIGNSILQYERFENDASKCSYTLEGDWKKFDSTIYIQGVTISVALMRCFYINESKRTDYHFTALYDTVAIKDYIVPGGYIYRLYHGIPSGVKATTVLTSLFCLFSLLYCTVDIDSKKLSFIVGGDDHVILVKDKISVKKFIYQRISDLRHEFEILT